MAAAFHAVDPAQLERAGGEDAAGVAGRDHRIGFAFVDQFDGAHDRAILFLADACDGLSSMVSTSLAWTISHAVIAQADAGARRRGFRFVADQEERGDPRVGFEARLAPSMTTPQPWSPPMTSTAIRITEGRGSGAALRVRNSGSGGDGDDLAPLVVAAGGANPVRHVRGRALRTGAELRQGQHAVIRAAHALAAFRWFSLGNTHKLILKLKFQFVQLGPGRRILSVLPAPLAFLCLATWRLWQAAAIRFTQRMLRKLEENIFPHIGRQVHAIVHHRRRYPRLPAADGRPSRSAPGRYSNGLRQRTHWQSSVRRSWPWTSRPSSSFCTSRSYCSGWLDLDHFVARYRYPVPRRQFALQTDVVRLQMAQIDEQRHRFLI